MALTEGLGKYVTLSTKRTHFALSSESLDLLATVKKERLATAAACPAYANRSSCFVWSYGVFSPQEEELIETVIADSNNFIPFNSSADAEVLRTYLLIVEFAAVCSFTLSPHFELSVCSVEAAQRLVGRVRGLFRPVVWDADAERYRATGVGGDQWRKDINLDDFGDLVVHEAPVVVAPKNDETRGVSSSVGDSIRSSRTQPLLGSGTSRHNASKEAAVAPRKQRSRKGNPSHT